jgi:vitamin B12 transporter
MRRSNTRTQTFALVTILALPASAGTAQVRYLPEIVISAHQFPVEATRVGSAVTVLEGDKLRAEDVPTLADALRTVPGLTLHQSGPRGTLTEVRMRGAEANQLLVLIDGIEVNALADGRFDFADFSVEEVDRIEVIRGPQSGIYGSNANAGVITIVTRSGKGLKNPHFDARIAGGTMNSYGGGFNLRGAVGPLYGSVTFNGHESDGYNISRFGSERDGSRAATATGKFGIDFSEHLNIEGVVRYTGRTVGNDPQDFMSGSPTYGIVLDGPGWTDYENLAARIGATLKLFDGRWVQSINAKLFDETLSSNDGTFDTELGGKRHSFDYKSTLHFDTNLAGGERHTLSFLADHRSEEFYASYLPGTTFEKKRAGLAGEYALDLPTHTTLSGALRHDWNEPFQDAVTWRLALSQRLPATGSRIHASAGKGITDPDHLEVLGYPAFFILPNPDLRPESSVGWDVGLEQTIWGGRLVTDVTYFNTVFRDKIEATFVGPNSLFVNTPGKATREGVELSGTLHTTENISLALTYTYTDARNSMNDPEFRRPAHSGSAQITFLSPDRRGRATIGATYNGARRDIRFNDFPTPNSFVVMPAATVVWANLSYDVTDSATLYARIENLFDRRYEEILTYRAQPFAAYAGLRVKFGAE